VGDDGLTDRERAFVSALPATGFRGGPAYRLVNPHVTANSAKVEASRMLTRPNVRAAVERSRRAHMATLSMSGTEVMGQIAAIARVRPWMMFDQEGRQLAPHEWPEEFGAAVESFEVRPDGGVKVKLASKAFALRTIGEVTGKFRNPVADQVSALARAIRATLGLPEPGAEEAAR
jgi:hypothetical protein